MYTGNTEKNDLTPFHIPVYPCVYREHIYGNASNMIIHGLSLCIQGTLNVFVSRYITLRFIPVYTGNTAIFCRSTVAPPVYPCVYREHSKTDFIVFRFCGLSLCIQGTLSVCIRFNYKSRFIPVYTGNTPISSHSLSGPPVYPCVYREHF